MAKPIRALELPYPMIQFLIIRDNTARLAPGFVENARLPRRNECRLSFELEESEKAPRSVIRRSLEPNEITKYMRQTSVINSIKCNQYKL